MDRESIVVAVDALGIVGVSWALRHL